MLAWAGLSETDLFANLQYQGFRSPTDCYGFAFESPDSQWNTWLSEVVKLDPAEIHRFRVVVTAVAQAGCLQQFEELANRANVQEASTQSLLRKARKHVQDASAASQELMTYMP